MRFSYHLRLIILVAFGLLTLLTAPGFGREPNGLCLEVEKDGAYVLGHSDFVKAGIPINKIDPRTIGLFNDGKPVPIYVFCQNPAEFRTSDTLVFYGIYPRGVTTTVRPENEINHYYLKWGLKNPLRYSAAPPFSPSNPREFQITNCFRYTERTERNYSFEKFYHPEGEETDYYFWTRIDPSMDAKDRSFSLYHHVYPNLTADYPNTFDLRVKFYGISRASISPQHHVQLFVGEKMIGEAKWDGAKEYVLEAKNIPASLLGKSPGQTTFELRFPKERVDQDVVDVVMLDWVDFSYWKATHSINAMYCEFNTEKQPFAQYRFLVSGLKGGERDVVLFNRTNNEIFLPGAIPDAEGKGLNYMFFVQPGQARTDYVMLNQHMINPPKGVRALYDEPAFAANSQTDMIIIAYPEFLEEAEQLAKYRRSQGLKVLVVDLQTIFDRYSEGFMEDKALRDYLEFACTKYRNPKPRYVLFVGDATWDYRHIKYPKDRNLLPIHWQPSPEWRWGGYPSENWYVAFGEDSKRPSMALGRIPVNQKGQLTVILEKMKTYEKTLQQRPVWLNKALLLTSTESGFQETVQMTASQYLEPAGFQCEVLTPTAATANNDTKVLTQKIDEGCSLIYYYGHGGSFNWRVGPVDYSRQRDLFTGDSVRSLTNKNLYPIVLATSCYSVSFDNYLSIGEVFLMEPDKGATAVVATAWKSEASTDHTFHTELIRQMYHEKLGRLGDAFVKAKQQLYDSGVRAEMFESMILLGDPALKLHHPASGK